jgi:Xaa-Pro aminopeptidase
MTNVEIAPIELPEFGLPTVEPSIPAETYERRIQLAQMRMSATQDTEQMALVMYGDREHFANLAYLTGYDPRFEEAMLILSSRRAGAAGTEVWNTPVLVVGNEGWSYAEVCPIEHRRVLYQSFSLPGQPRGDSLSLEEIFHEAGIQNGSFVGVVGWKYFDERETASPRTTLEIPSFIADTLRNIVGARERVVNMTHQFMDPYDGLRAVNEVDQLAAFEFAATHTSQSLRNVLFGLKPGMTEYDAVRLMGLNGIPLSCHLMLASGPRVALGLASPSMRAIQQGEPLMMALGLWGGLNARAGFVVRDASELPDGIQDYVDRLVAPYFRAIVAWYEHVGIGVAGGELYDIIHQHLDDPFFGVGLNPGHLIHLDEWLHSPIYKGSDLRLKSGMAIQVDVIPATHSPYFTTNIEDGIALANDELRAAFERKYPEAWGRIQARRRFMEDVIGIRLRREVLPFSNIPAYLAPYLLSPGVAMRVV